MIRPLNGYLGMSVSLRSCPMLMAYNYAIISRGLHEVQTYLSVRRHPDTTTTTALYVGLAGMATLGMG